MTKVIILGEKADQNKNLKKIKFVKLLSDRYTVEESETPPIEFKNVELVCFNYDEGKSGSMDLMFAYDDERNKGILYLGHFNDGIV